MMDEREILTRSFARTANGFGRAAVVNAGGNMIINAIRQSHAKLPDALLELDDLVERMKAALKENHYDENQERRVTNIVVPSPAELFPELRG